MNRQQSTRTADGLENIGQQLIQIECPHCRSPLDVTEQAADIACSSCGNRFQIDPNRTASWQQDRQRQLGKFTLLEQVGRGAFGTVYRAHDSELDRVVAIKVPRGGRFTLRDEEEESSRFTMSGAPRTFLTSWRSLFRA
jgi:LSD1 subclass zinc finger protein